MKTAKLFMVTRPDAMEKSRWFSIVMLLGSAFMILLIIIYRDDLGVSLEPLQALHDRQEQRRLLLKEMCSSDNLTFPEKKRSFDDIPDEELKYLIVNDKHGIIYCFVPKVGCTNWKRVMLVLSGIQQQDGSPYKDPLAIPYDLVHSESTQFTFDTFRERYGDSSRQLMKMKLKNYTKFLFVRDPFERLISAYRDKFEKHDDNEIFYSYARDMLRRYANKTAPASDRDAFAMGLRPSFAHFMQYLLDPQTEKNKPFDEHWLQMYRLCHPCQIQYDFVGHMESVEEDAEQLLRQLRVDDVVKFPMSHQRDITTSNWLAEWFSTVPLAARRELYKLYETDFKLFGYDRPDSILNESQALLEK